MKKLCMATFVVMVYILSYLLMPGCTAAGACGGHALGGLSLYMERFVESGQRLYEEEDLDLLSEVMYHENFDNGEYVMRLTGPVVLNRVRHKGFPSTIRDVLYQKGQYSTTKLFHTKKIPEEVISIAKELLIFGSIAPENVIWQSMFPQGKGIWFEYNHEYFCY